METVFQFCDRVTAQRGMLIHFGGLARKGGGCGGKGKGGRGGRRGGKR